MFLDFSVVCFFFFKQKTAYEMRISDWSSDVCSSDLCWCVRPKRYGDPCQRSIPATHKSRPWRPGYAARSIPLVFSRPAVSWGRRMQTNFAPEQLADPAMRTSEAEIGRAHV